MDLGWQILINGVLTGSIYVLVALGFTLIFGIMRVVNFSHGEFYMIGGFAVYVLNTTMHLNFFLALLCAGLLVALVGIVLERFLFRPVAKNETSTMIMSLAISMVLQGIALKIFGPNELSIDRPVTGILQIGELIIPRDRLVVCLCCAVILAVFYAYLKWSKTGLAMRAVAQDDQVATLMGVLSSRTNTTAFAIAAALAGLAGGLVAPIYTVSPYVGETPMLKAFVVVILGGLGSIPGAVAGGMIIGLVESFFGTMFNSTIALIASFAICLGVIAVRPTGLMGKA